VLHAATEKFSPDGLYGKWFSPLMILICALWLLGGWLIDRLKTEAPSPAPLAQTGPLGS
jgi:hypothetical protein